LAKHRGVHEETISSGASTRSNSPAPQLPSEAPPMGAVQHTSPVKMHPGPGPSDAFLRTVPSPPPMHSHPYGGNWQPHPASLNGVSSGLKKNSFGKGCSWLLVASGGGSLASRRCRLWSVVGLCSVKTCMHNISAVFFSSFFIVFFFYLFLRFFSFKFF
jgi:hypothetical protein